MSYSTGTIKIPVLFDMSGDTIVYGEEASGDFVSSHLDFLLDMTTEANDISLNAADISGSILIGDQDTGDNIFYSGGSTGNIAVDNLCNRIAKAITRGKLVHVPKSGDHSNSGIPMGGRSNLTNNLGELGSTYAIKYLTSVAPIGDEQMLGQAMARVASIHLVGSPLAAGIFEDQNQIQTDLETASSQTFNSGNTAFYNALAVQLSKVLGGSKSSAPMNAGVTASIPGGDLASQEFYENFNSLTVGDNYNMGGTGANNQAMVVDGTGTTNYGATQSPHPDPRVPGSLYIRLATTEHNHAKLYHDTTTVRAISFWHHLHQSPWIHADAGKNSLIGAIVAGDKEKCQIYRGGRAVSPHYQSNYGGNAAGEANIQWWVDGVKITTGTPAFSEWEHTPTNLYEWHHHYIDLGPGYTANDITQVRMGTIHSPTQNFQFKNYGYLDDIRFFDERLTDVQIQDLAAGNNGNVGGGTTVRQPLDASGTSVPALKSIYEQLMNVPGRSQIMESRDVSGVVDNSNVTIAGGFPFITGDKLVMYLRPKIVFAAQTKAEQSTTLITASGPVATTIDVPVYDIGRKSSAGGSISGQVYTNSSSHDDSDTWGFHKCFEGDHTDDEDWTTAGDTNHQYSTSSPFDYMGDRKTINIGETKNITVTTARLQNDNQIVDTEDGFIYGIGFVNRLNIQAGDTVTYEHPTLGSQTTTVSQVNSGGAAPSKPYLIVLTDNHNITVGTPINSCTFHNKKEGLVGEWGQVDIGQDTVINKFQIWPRPSRRTTRSPSDFSLLGSTDGTNWTTIKAVSGLVGNDWDTGNGNTPAGTITWELGSVHGAYRYYRISVQSVVGSGDGRLSLTGLLLYGAKSPSEVTTGSTGALTDISGIETNIVATSENIEDAFPGNATAGPEPEINKWGWMGSTTSDSLSLETTDVTDVRTCDLHIWKITITL